MAEKLFFGNMFLLLLVPLSEGVEFSCLAVVKRKSRILVRFLWNWVSERFLMSIFWKKKSVKFWSLFRPNFLPKSLGAPIWSIWRPAMADGGTYGISVPFGCTFGVRLHVDLTLLNMKIILDTQILKKFRVERILVPVRDAALQPFLGRFWAEIWDSREFLKESCRKNKILKNQECNS